MGAKKISRQSLRTLVAHAPRLHSVIPSALRSTVIQYERSRYRVIGTQCVSSCFPNPVTAVHLYALGHGTGPAPPPPLFVPPVRRLFRSRCTATAPWPVAEALPSLSWGQRKLHWVRINRWQPCSYCRVRLYLVGSKNNGIWRNIRGDAVIYLVSPDI